MVGIVLICIMIRIIVVLAGTCVVVQHRFVVRVGVLNAVVTLIVQVVQHVIFGVLVKSTCFSPQSALTVNGVMMTLIPQAVGT